jgi:hypothetical protein
MLQRVAVDETNMLFFVALLPIMCLTVQQLPFLRMRDVYKHMPLYALWISLLQSLLFLQAWVEREMNLAYSLISSSTVLGECRSAVAVVLILQALVDQEMMRVYSLISNTAQ